MNNPGYYNLGSATITAAGSDVVITDGTSIQGVAQSYIDRLDGMTAISIQIEFDYGSGGTEVKAYVQTSLDQADTWIDVISATFTLASAIKIFNLSALTPVTEAVAPTDGSLGDDYVVDGILGDRLRVKYTSTGTFAGQTRLKVGAVAR